jgi:hypothetical protein
MADTLTNISNFITSPPGRLLAGVVLAGIVWKCFEKIEAVLSDDTKLGIAVWLLDLRIGKAVEPWANTFIRIFDRVFGPTHLSLKCFARSAVVSLSGFALAVILLLPEPWKTLSTGLSISLDGSSTGHIAPMWQDLSVAVIFGLIIPDYISLLETRLSIKLLGRWHGLWSSLLILAGDALITSVTALVGAVVGIDYAGVFFRDNWYGRLLDLLTLPGLVLFTLRLPLVALFLKVTGHNFQEPVLLFYPGCISCLWFGCTLAAVSFSNSPAASTASLSGSTRRLTSNTNPSQPSA